MRKEQLRPERSDLPGEARRAEGNCDGDAGMDGRPSATARRCRRSAEQTPKHLHTNHTGDSSTMWSRSGPSEPLHGRGLHYPKYPCSSSRANEHTKVIWRNFTRTSSAVTHSWRPMSTAQAPQNDRHHPRCIHAPKISTARKRHAKHVPASESPSPDRPQTARTHGQPIWSHRSTRGACDSSHRRAVQRMVYDPAASL